MQNFPLVSIVTPVFNGAPFLDELIVSVRDQDYPNVEHIIINDGSSDNGLTETILKKYPHIQWWSRENHGQYYSMNEGLLAAKGDIICFISADDILAKNAIKHVIEWLSENPGYEAVYGLTGYFSELKKSVKINQLVRYAPLRYYAYFPYFAQVQHCSLYINKNVIIKNNLMFDPKIKYVGDYDWIIRILNANVHIGFISKVLSIVRIHKNQLSTQNKVEMAKEKVKVAQRHGYSGMQFIFYIKMIRNKIVGSNL